MADAPSNLTMRSSSRGYRAIDWIEKYCLYPAGPQRGQRVRLSPEQCATIRAIYDHPDGRQPMEISTNPLAAYLALLHVCGIEAKRDEEPTPIITTDIFTLWNAAGPDLKAVLKRDAGHVVCPELGTRFPAAA
jgi:hypothetical protein